MEFPARFGEGTTRREPFTLAVLLRPIAVIGCVTFAVYVFSTETSQPAVLLFIKYAWLSPLLTFFWAKF